MASSVAISPVRTADVENLIFDVGLNIGQDTAFYLAQGYRVIAVEADPVLAEAAHKRFERQIEEGRLEIVNVGVAERDGFADFWICEEKPEFNSFHRAIAARDSYAHKCIQIPVMRFSKIVERYGVPYFLKIDIEGNDMLCLDGLSSSSLPKYLSLESECPMDEQSASVEDGLRVLQKLNNLGYRKFKLIDQHTFCSLTLPASLHQQADALGRKMLKGLSTRHLRDFGLISRSLLLRRRLEMRFRREFPMGSSGVWGEDTPGTWISYAEAERAYKYYRERHFQDSEATFHSFWCDWHARL
jgi:FkbM family methyltransferase